jgi:hypothetical protein
MSQCLHIQVTAEQLATICMCLDYCVQSQMEEGARIFDTTDEAAEAATLSSRLTGKLK